jgi:uncharacterized protein YoxC
MTGRTITQRISLTGGAEIKAQLEQIGTAAAAAFEKLAASGNVSAGLAKIGSSVEVLTTRVRALGNAANNFGNSFGQFESSVGRTARNAGLLVGGFTAVVGGFGLMVKSAGEGQESLQNLADVLGVTVERLKAVKDAADISGVGDITEKSLRHLQKAMGDAGKASDDYKNKLKALNRDFGNQKIGFDQYNASLQRLNEEFSDTGNVFKDLGVSIRNADGSLRDPLETLNDVADAFKELPNGVDKANKSFALFGTRNAKFGTFLNQGSDGIKQLTLEAQRLAPALDKVGREALDRASDSFDKLGKASDATKNQILAVFAPSVARLVEAFTESTVRGRAAWIAYAQAIEARVKPIVNDIVALLEGRDSDVQNQAIVKARDAFIQFGADAKNAITNIVIPALSALLVVLQNVADAINGIFGTKLTGGQIAIALVITKLIGLFGVFTSAVRLAYSAAVLLVTSLGTVTSAMGVLYRVIGLVIASLGVVPVAIAAVGFAIGFLVVTAVQSLGGISGIIDKVTAGFAALGNVIRTIAANIASGFATAFAAVVAFAQSTWQAIVASASALGTALVEGFNGVVQAIIAFFVGLPQAITDAFTAVLTAVTTAWDALKQGAMDVVTSIVNGFRSGVDSVIGFFNGLLERAKAIFASIVEGAKAVASAIAAVASGGGGAKAPGFAGGGHLRGPGSGTSDSMTVRVSNNEFIHRAAAVRKYGLAFMHALNQGRISVGRIREIMGGIDTSGLAARISAPLMAGIPGYRNGGLVTEGVSGSGGHPLTLQIGGQSIGGMTASPDAARQLQRAAVGQALRSAGRKPSWVR